MTYNKTNKTHHCASRLRAAIRLKCRNKFTIKKKSFCPPTINFLAKFLGSKSIPIMAIKRSTKVHKSRRHRGLGAERIVTPHISNKIKNCWRHTNPHHYQHITHQILGISSIRPRSFIAYRHSPHHYAPRNQASHLRTTYSYSFPYPYLVEKESLYLF